MSADAWPVSLPMAYDGTGHHEVMHRPLLAVAVLLGLAAPAQAAIVLGESIGGVRIGATKPDVVKRLGKPLDRRTERTPFGKTKVLGYDKLTVTLLREGANANVVAVRTERERDRTPGGIGVGSTRRAVARTVARVRCKDGFCRVGKRRRGRTITQFDLERGRVDSVLLAKVLSRR
jgi:hypothetical protein